MKKLCNGDVVKYIGNKCASEIASSLNLNWVEHTTDAVGIICNVYRKISNDVFVYKVTIERNIEIENTTIFSFQYFYSFELEVYD